MPCRPPPERSGLGAFAVLRALVSLLAFVVAKRWRVRCGTSESSQRDRPGVRGAWRAGCAADVRIVRAYRGRASGVLVESLIVSRRPRHPPLRSTGGWRGLRRSCAWAGSSWWLFTPPRAVWLTLPERARVECE